eukprot:1151673-Pelagomonas_calceolata.AAC.3
MVMMTCACHRVVMMTYACLENAAAGWGEGREAQHARFASIHVTKRSTGMKHRDEANAFAQERHPPL